MSPALSCERPAPGLVIWQPARGFRFALDPFILAGWALEGGAPGSFLDAGTGSGVIALLVGRLGFAGEGVDIKDEWIALARRSAAQSEDVFGRPLAERLDFQVQDLRARQADPVDLVLCNPPYRQPGRGPLPADPLAAAARVALHGDLDALIPALCRAGRRVAMVLPAIRAEEAIALLAASGTPLARRCNVGQVLVLLEGRSDHSGPVSFEAIDAPAERRFPARVRDWYAALGAPLPQIG